MKKITILVDQLHSHGGIEKLVAIKANYWTDVFGYQVTIISTDQKKLPSIYPISDLVKQIDLDINYNNQKSFYSITNLLKLLKNIFLVQKYFFQSKPDFVLVASHIPLTYIVPTMFTKARVIKEFHYSQFYMNTKNIGAKVQNFMIKKYHFVVVLSQEEKMFYDPKNSLVISNPIVKSKNESSINSVTKDDTAIFVGRLAPVKQVTILIDIWKKFSAIKPNWQLHIFGAIDSNYAFEIQETIQREKLENTIVLKGQSSKVDEAISKSKVLLLTSSQECFPMVILEAQSLGTPVISFDSPTGPRNIITNEFDGILVEHNNIDKFVTALIRFDEDENTQKRLVSNGLETSKVYNLDVIMNQWNDLIFKK